MYGRVDYAIERNPLRNINLSYMFTYHDLDVYNRGDKIVNTTYRHHFVELGYSDMNWLNFKLKLGAVMSISIITHSLYGGNQSIK